MSKREEMRWEARRQKNVSRCLYITICFHLNPNVYAELPMYCGRAGGKSAKTQLMSKSKTLKVCQKARTLLSEMNFIGK